MRGKEEPGTYRLIWNGTDDQGRQVATGNYFYQISLDARRLVKKMLLLK